MVEEKSQDNIKTLFTKELEKKRLRKTPERYAILDIVSATSKPFDVQYINEKMQHEKFAITLTTIYNTLALLERCKIIRAYKLKDKTLYEKGIDQQIYVNLICNECGKVSRRKDPLLSQIIKEKRYGRFNSTFHTLNIYGVCNACGKKSKKEKQVIKVGLESKKEKQLLKTNSNSKKVHQSAKSVKDKKK